MTGSGKILLSYLHIPAAVEGQVADWKVKEVTEMAELPKELKFLLFGRGTKFYARVALALEFLGLVSLVLGIVRWAWGRPSGYWLPLPSGYGPSGPG